MEIKEAVESLQEKMREFKSEVNESTKKEIKRVEEEAAKEKKALTEKVNELNLKVADKDGTIDDIQQEVKELKAKGGRFKAGNGIMKFEGLRGTISNEIAKALGEKKEEIGNSGAGGSMLMKPTYITPFRELTPEQKTVGNISSANLTVDNFVSYLDWRPGMEPTGQFHFRNLVRTIISETDNIQFPRANTPIGEGSFGRQTTEGAAKSQVDRDYTMITLTLYPMAAYAIVSRQSLRNIIFLQSWLPESMMAQMEESEDTEFANTLVAAATTSANTTGFSGTPNVADKLVIYMKNLMKLKHTPTATAVDPNVWANLILLRPGTAGESYSGPVPVVVDTNGTVRVLGKPVYPVNWLTGNRIIVGDWTKAAIIQSEGLRLRQSDSHANIFTSNEIAFLLERTEGLAIFRPDAFTTTTIS
jgi:hypothetical protein